MAVPISNLPFDFPPNLYHAIARPVRSPSTLHIWLRELLIPSAATTIYDSASGYAMRSPVVIIRFVFLSLIAYLNIFALVFAGWNIGATKAAGLEVQGGAVFLIFNACFLAMFLVGVLAELVFPEAKAKTALVAYECLWTGLMAILELAASVAITVSGPPLMCRPNAPFSVCASSTVLVPVSWLAGILMLAYFLAIFSTSIAHMGEYPDIFSHTIYSAPWFGMEARADDKPPQLPLLGLGNHSSTHLANFPISLSQGNQSSTSLPRDVERAPQADIEKPESAQDKTRPWWALQRVYRPGKDQPFAVLSRKSKAKEQPPAQVYRPTSYHGSIVYPERERRLRDQKPLPPYPQITEEMLDPDKPIPLPRLSAWVRADEARGITTRTMPIPSPAREEFVTRQWHNRDDDYDF